MSGENYYEPAYEEAKDLYQKGEVLFRQDKIHEADTYLQKAVDMRVPYLQLYLLKIECDLRLKNLKQALGYCNQAIEILDDPKCHIRDSLAHRLDLLHSKSKIYHEMQIFDKALKEMDKIESVLKKAFEEHKISYDEYKELSNKFSQETKIIKLAVSEPKSRNSEKTEHLQEAKTVLELLQDEEENSYLRRECSLVHIISTRWFEKWKQYSGFYQLTGEKPEYHLDLVNDETKDYANGKGEHPGPIDSHDILDHSTFLTDPDKVKDYTNYQLELGLQENKDFIIVSHRLWKYLNGIYGGTDIKRYTICLNDETQVTAVEVWLKRINVIQMPTISADQDLAYCQLSTVFLSRKETVKDLREKLTRIYQKEMKIHPKVQLNTCKLWKVNPRYDYNEALSKIRNPQGRVIIKAVKLNEQTVLEDAELGDDDVIICEYKINDEWVFISEEEYQTIVSDRCACCGSSRKDLFYCECRTVKYCNQICQKNHRPYHREKCVQIKGEVNRTNEIYSHFKISRDSKFTSTSRYGLVGLQNFGNTCFMNTCLQCLSNVWELSNYFIKNEFIKDINRENKLGTGGRLAAAYAELMKEMWCGSEQSISPWEVKKIIGEVAPQFMGYNQQDTQEFLSYLLDGIHEDLNRVKHKPYVEVKEAEGRPDEVFAMESWTNHLKRNRSIIVDLMHGQYKSKLICPDCQKVSITFDPFSTLSLPIPIQRMITLPLYFIFKDSSLHSHLKINLNLMPNAPVSEILQQLSRMLKLPVEALELKILRDHQIIEHDTSRYDVKSLKEHEGIPFVYQIHTPYIDPPLDKFNVRKLVRVELIINQKLKKNAYSEPKSFHRMFYISQEQTLKHLHLQAFTIMRVHVANFVNNEEELRKKIDISIEGMTHSILEKQYEDVLSLSQVDLLPYNIYFVTNPDGGDEGRVLIPYSADKKISDTFTLDSNREIVLELTINPRIRSEYLKLNKCKEADSLPQMMSEPKSYNIYDCFNLFITPEVLDKDNTWYCSNCKDHKQATKTMEIYTTPKILIIHLKRFRTNRVSSIGSFFYTSSSSKITSLIEYPVVGLDLRNYVLGKYEKEPIYDLFAISNHYGGMGGGHYTAYAKNPKKNAWYDFNDSMVSRQNPDELVTSAAYVLFYRRRDDDMSMSPIEVKNGGGPTQKDYA